MLIPITDEKVCTKCNVRQHLSDFYDRPKAPDGKMTQCSSCIRERTALRYQQNPESPEHKAVRMAAYRASDKGKATQAAYTARTLEKRRIYHREWSRKKYGHQPRKPKRSAEEQRQAIRAAALKTKYKIDQTVYDRMFKEQNGLCAVCDNPPLGKATTQMLAVDHCHATGTVRGLLCHKCNAAIGFLGDSPELVKKALDYLRLHI